MKSKTNEQRRKRLIREDIEFIEWIGGFIAFLIGLGIFGLADKYGVLVYVLDGIFLTAVFGGWVLYRKKKGKKIQIFR